MPNFKKNNSIVPDKTSRSRKRSPESASALEKAQKRIARQAALALLTVILTVVLIFAMTSAWYTNIIQSSGLTFVAEAWGFNGEITVNTKSIEAAPGDEGIIEMTVINKDTNITDINVNVSKTQMSEEMEQRLFFYADAQLTRNGETMDRVYLNNRDNYTYTLFSNGTLNLSEEMHNGALLKWHWVYDVLGYYVIGKWDAAAGKMIVDEYLRPIEYNYDDATTTFEKVSTLEDGTPISRYVLKTVDGTTSVESFLVNLSKTDGYAGQINPTVAVGDQDKYYPVNGQGYEDGYGIYAYMCNYSQIQKATEYDTALGQARYTLLETADKVTVDGITAEELVSRVTLTLSAQKSENKTINVTTMAGLKQAMALKNVDVIQLSDDLTITENETLTLEAGQRLMIDLNGNTITSVMGEDNLNKVAIKALPGSSLTLLNGTLVGKIEEELTDPDAPTEPEETTPATVAGYAVYATGAEVVLSNVDVKDFKYGLYVSDSDNKNTLDSRIYLNQCTIDAKNNAVLLYGNGYLSNQKTQLVIEGSTLTSDGITISGNGTSAGDSSKWGTDIQILGGSKIISRATELAKAGAGIYHPQKDSTLTVHGSEVSGYTGIAIKGGSVKIINSTITGTGETVMEPKFYSSGYADTADAVYIETNYEYDIDLTISGSSELISKYGLSLQVFEKDAPFVMVKIISGTFKEVQPDAYIAEGSEQTGSNITVKTTTDTGTSEDPDAVN